MSTQKDDKKSTDKLGAVHHYVPQGYLRRFAVDGKPDHVVGYEIGKDPYTTNVHNVAGQRDFYTFLDLESGKSDSALENAFADIDSMGIDLLRLLDEMPVGYLELPEDQKGNLLAYIAFQHTRNLQERKMWATSYEQSTGMMMQAQASDKESFHEDAKKHFGKSYDVEKVESARISLLNGEAKIKFDPMDQYFIGVALEMSKTLYKILFTQKKMVLVEKTLGSGPFVASDNPVTHYLTEEQRAKQPPFMQGVGYLQAIFQIPISPSRCLLLINNDMEMETFHYDQDAVDYINWHTYHLADRWIFSNLERDTIKEHFQKFKRTTPITSLSSPFDRAKKRRDSQSAD